MRKNKLAHWVAAYLGFAVAILGHNPNLYAQKATRQPRLLRITDSVEIQTLRAKFNSPPNQIELASWMEDQPECSKPQIAALLFSELPPKQVDGLQAISTIDTALRPSWDSTWYDQIKKMIDLQPSHLDWICAALTRMDPRRAFIDLRALYETKDLDPTYRRTALLYLGFSSPEEEVVRYLVQVVTQSRNKKDRQEDLRTAKQQLMWIFSNGPAHMRGLIESFFLEEIKQERAQDPAFDVVRTLAQWPSMALSPYLKKSLDADMAAGERLYDDFLRAYAELDPMEARPFVEYALSLDDPGSSEAGCIPLAWQMDPEEGYRHLRAAWESFYLSPYERVELSFQLGGEAMAKRAISTMETEEQEKATKYLEEHILPLGKSHPLHKLSEQFHAAGIVPSPFSDKVLDSLRTQNKYMNDWPSVLAKVIPGFVPRRHSVSTSNNKFAALSWTEALRPRMRNLLPEPYEELMCRGCQLADTPLRFLIWRGVAYGCEDENGKPCNRLQDFFHIYNQVLSDAGVQERLYVVKRDLYDIEAFIMRPPQATALFKMMGVEPL